MKDTYSRGYKAAALVLLLIELAVLCLPVFGGSTAFLLLKGFWQHGNQLQHIAAPLLLLARPDARVRGVSSCLGKSARAFAAALRLLCLS